MDYCFGGYIFNHIKGNGELYIKRNGRRCGSTSCVLECMGRATANEPVALAACSLGERRTLAAHYITRRWDPETNALVCNTLWCQIVN